MRGQTKKVLKYGAIGAASFIGLWLIILTSLWPFQRMQDKRYVRENVIPVVEYVETFRETHGRLLTKNEFSIWSKKEYPHQLVVYYSEKPEFMDTWGKEGHDFMIGRWRGEWVHYYCTWDQSDFAGSLHK